MVILGKKPKLRELTLGVTTYLLNGRTYYTRRSTLSNYPMESRNNYLFEVTAAQIVGTSWTSRYGLGVLGTLVGVRDPLSVDGGKGMTDDIVRAWSGVGVNTAYPRDWIRRIGFLGVGTTFDIF
ncbi:hypothetical protein Tco_0480381 [Tanacetum coccineum]